jgi:hypothetical protein
LNIGHCYADECSLDETIRCHGADDLRFYINDGDLRAMSDRCPANNLPYPAATRDEHIALQILCGFHAVHGHDLRAYPFTYTERASMA